MTVHARIAALSLVCLLGACGGGGSPATTATTGNGATAATMSAPVTPPTLAQVGDRLFNETTLSASGKLACASCHVEAGGHADAPGGFLPLGGADGTRQGLRSSPSARYLDQAGPFRFDAQGRPHGGLFWDGRASSRAEQARGPVVQCRRDGQRRFGCARHSAARPALHRRPAHGCQPACSRYRRPARRCRHHRAGPLPGGGRQLPPLHQQVRRRAGRPRRLHRPGAARPQPLQRPAARQLRQLPRQPPGTGQYARAVHQLQLSRTGRAAQRQPGHARPRLLRLGPVRPRRPGRPH